MFTPAKDEQDCSVAMQNTAATAAAAVDELSDEI